MAETVDVREAAAIVQDMHQFHYRAWDKMDDMERIAKGLKGRVPSGGDELLKEMGGISDFLLQDVGPHFRMEEAKVYPLVKRLMLPRKRVAIAYMIKDHHAVYRQVVQLRQLLQVAGESSPDANAEQNASIALLSIEMVRLVRRHIVKENIVYQTLEKVL